MITERDLVMRSTLMEIYTSASLLKGEQREKELTNGMTGRSMRESGFMVGNMGMVFGKVHQEIPILVNGGTVKLVDTESL